MKVKSTRELNYFTTQTNETLIYSCFQLKRKSLTENIYGVTFFRSPSSSFRRLLILIVIISCCLFFFRLCTQEYSWLPRFFPYIAKDEDGEKNVVLMYFSRPVTRIFSPSALFFFIFIFIRKRKKTRKISTKNRKMSQTMKSFLSFNKDFPLIFTDAILINFHRLLEYIKELFRLSFDLFFPSVVFLRFQCRVKDFYTRISIYRDFNLVNYKLVAHLSTIRKFRLCDKMSVNASQRLSSTMFDY